MNSPTPPTTTILDADALDGLRAHPLSDIFPAMGGDDFDQLTADAMERGAIINPVTLYEGMILSGRARVAIARQLRIPCPAWHYDGPDPLGYAVAQNCLRKHYTTGQRTMIAAQIANMSQGERTDLPQPSAPVPKVSQEQAAKMMGVGVRSVGNGRFILDHGTPEEIEAACSGRQDPRPLATSIRRRIDGGHDPVERDHVDKALSTLEAALADIGTFRGFHVEVEDIVRRLVEREDGRRLDNIAKLIDAHDPVRLFTELRTAVSAALNDDNEPAPTDEDADDEHRRRTTNLSDVEPEGNA